MRIFILSDERLDYLKTQLKLIERYISSKQIFLVRGPYNNKYLPKNYKLPNGIIPISVPGTRLTKWQNIHSTLKFLWDGFDCSNYENLFIHGDTMPVGKFSVPNEVKIGGAKNFSLTWLYNKPGVEVKSFQQVSKREDYWGQNLTSLDVKNFTQLFPNEKYIYMEYILPNFIHLDGGSSDSDELLKRKAKLASKLLDVNQHKNGWAEQIKSFAKSYKEWTDNRKPLRTDEEVERIYNDICEPCEFFKKGRCDLCGCNLKTKIKWQTTKCPHNPPKW